MTQRPKVDLLIPYWGSIVIFYTDIKERKNKFWLLYQKNGCPGLQGITLISVYNPFTTGGQP